MEPGSANLMFSPPGRSIAAGATFQVPVVLTGGKDIASVPLQTQYDPAKLSLVNVTNGDLLSRDNQAVALVHLDDGPGSITIKAARPPDWPASVVRALSASSVSSPDGRRDTAFPHSSCRHQPHPAAVAVQGLTGHHHGTSKRHAAESYDANLVGPQT